MRFIAFDLETTGTIPGVDTVVEIGAVRFLDDHIDGVFSTLVDPQRPIPPEASRINGIKDEMVSGKPLMKDLLEPFAEFCQGDVLVAHNAPFDFQFLLAEIKKHECQGPGGSVLDTLSIAKKVYPGLANYKLSTLIHYLEIETTDFHRAEEDASYCGWLFHRMLKKISANQDPPIENLIALTGKPELKFPKIERQFRQLSLL